MATEYDEYDGQYTGEQIDSALAKAAGIPNNAVFTDTLLSNGAALPEGTETVDDVTVCGKYLITAEQAPEIDFLPDSLTNCPSVLLVLPGYFSNIPNSLPLQILMGFNSSEETEFWYREPYVYPEDEEDENTELIFEYGDFIRVPSMVDIETLSKKHSLWEAPSFLSSSKNLNNILDDGVYYYQQNQAPSNVPETVASHLVVYRTASNNAATIVQFVFTEGRYPTLYIRRRNGSYQWSSWTRLDGGFSTLNELPSNANINSYRENNLGIYVCSAANAATVTGSPVNCAFRLEISLLTSGTTVVQKLIPNVGTSLNKPVLYYRTNVASTWSSWFKFEGTEVT